jgi:hypothetical protein
MDKILNNLYKDTINELDNLNFNVFEENNIVLQNILNSILNESYDPSKSDLYKNLITYLDLIYEKLFQMSQDQKAVENINKIYKLIYSSGRIGIFLYLPKSMDRLIKRMNEYRFHQQIELPINTLIYQMVKNSGLKNDEILIDNNIPSVLDGFIEAVRKNKILEGTEQQYLLDKLLEDVFHFNLYNKSNFVETIMYRTLTNILLNMIRAKDTYKIQRALEIINENSIHLNVDTSLIGKLYLTITIYLYYLAYKEEIEENEKKQYLDVINKLKTHFTTNLYFYNSKEFWIHYKEIRAELRKWELMDNKVKWLRMENVVREFFIFLTLKNDLDITEVDEVFLTEDDLFSIINEHFNRNKVSDEIKIYYGQFLEALSNEDRDIEYDMERLKEETLLKYKNFRFNKVRKESKQEGQINNNLTILNKELTDIVSDIPILVGMQDIEGENEESKLLQIKINTPISFLTTENSYNVRSFGDNVSKRLEYEILGVLLKSGIDYYPLIYTSTRKIKKLLDLVENYNATDNKINVFVSGILPDSPFLYQEEEIFKEYYKRFLETVKKNIQSKHRYWLGFNDETINIKVTKCEVKLIRFNLEALREKLHKLQSENNRYLINVTNEIYLPFAEDEAMEYLYLNDIQLQINVQISIIKKEHSKGFLIEINFEK